MTEESDRRNLMSAFSPFTPFGAAPKIIQLADGTLINTDHLIALRRVNVRAGGTVVTGGAVATKGV
jgi:hypothetical protein